VPAGLRRPAKRPERCITLRPRRSGFLGRGEARRGVGELDGRGEAVGGVVVSRFGENAFKVIQEAKLKLFELEDGLPAGVFVKTTYDRSALIDMLYQTPIERFLEAMAAGLNGPDAEGKDLKVNLVLTDQKTSYVLWIENAVLHFKKAPPEASANATLTLTKPIFIKMMAGTAGVKDTLLSDDLKIDGSKIDLVRFFSLIDKAPGTFQIVTK